MTLRRKFPPLKRNPSVPQSQPLQGYPLCRLRLPVMPGPRPPHVFWRVGLALRTSHDCCWRFSGCIQPPAGLTTKPGHGCCHLGQGWPSCSRLWAPVVIFGSTGEQAWFSEVGAALGGHWSQSRLPARFGGRELLRRDQSGLVSVMGMVLNKLLWWGPWC